MIRRIAETDPPGIDTLLTEFEGTLAFDVGANAGQSAEVLLRRFGTVVSYEPAEESFDLLKAVPVPEGRALVRCPYAVTSLVGSIELTVQAGHIATGQLTSTNPALRGESWQGPADPWGEVLGTRLVQATTLDVEMAKHGMPDLVKIDVEGHEVEVMKGAALVLAARRTSWFVECHSKELGDDVREMLLDAGYVPEMFRHPHYEQGSWGWENHNWLRAVPL